MSNKKELEKALIDSLKKEKIIYPSIYKRRFNIPLSDVIKIMNELSKNDLVSLRFKIETPEYSSNRLYKLDKLPESVYNEETDENIEVTNEIIRPVYEVISNE